MSISSKIGKAAAWTLVEMMVAVGLFSLSGAALATLYMFSIKSFAAMANYAVLDQENREAMDRITREIRQAKEVRNYVTNSTSSSLTLLNGDNQEVTYTFDARNQRLLRTVLGDSSIMLTNCSLLHFSLFTRPPPTNGVFEGYPAVIGSANWQKTVKVVQLTWKARRQVPAGPINSENIQTARIVIRKQQDY
jgi:hypothetical protein